MKDYITNIKPLNVKHTITSRKKTKPKLQQNVSNQEPINLKESQLCPISRKLRRKFTAEKIIDLHELTRDEAFCRLIFFFSKCQAENIKKVIVITGGNALKKSILRISFQDWIKNSFGNYIVSCSQADIHHGGEGAFYVILKNKTSAL
ncbi:MAG: Smr/MutS family protein [Holosporaceae bacterium]|jgi:DNA-nicking Smr family endonuclease|nr:Smr/MutS family protein [Holosporaceae bacterium]